MHTREIEIFQIARTALNEEQLKSWLSSIGAASFKLPEEETPSATLVGVAAKRCYMAFEEGLNPNITRVRKNWHKYLGNILKQKHGSVFEHATYTFAVENVTRVFTGEMNRHRAGVAISEGSMRYIRFDDIPYWLPHSLKKESQLLRSEGISDEEFEKRKRFTREIFGDVFEFVEDRYQRLLDLWDINEGNFDKKKKLTSLFRRIIPMGVCTGAVYTFNIRALRHVIGMRSHPAAEEEICFVTSSIAKMMVESLEPTMFSDFSLDAETGCWSPAHWKV